MAPSWCSLPLKAMGILTTSNSPAQLLLTRPRMGGYGLKAISIVLLGVPRPSSSNIPMTARLTTRSCLLPTVKDFLQIRTLRTLPAATPRQRLMPLPQPDSLSHRLVILASRTIIPSHRAKIEPVKKFLWKTLRRCSLRPPAYSLPSEWTWEVIIVTA